MFPARFHLLNNLCARLLLVLVERLRIEFGLMKSSGHQPDAGLDQVKSMRRCALLIHGISHFDEEYALQSARANLSASGYLAEDVMAFNWDLIVGDPEAGAEGPFNLRFLAEIGAGLLESAHLGFFESKYTNQGALVLQIHNFLAFLLQCVACLLPIWLAIAIRLHTTLLTCLIVSTVPVLMLLLASITESLGFFNASVRRVALVCAWPITYSIMVPIFVPGSLLLALFVAVCSSPFSLFSSSVEPDSFLHFFQGLCSICAYGGSASAAHVCDLEFSSSSADWNDCQAYGRCGPIYWLT
jgi:hypothetical protein